MFEYFNHASGVADETDNNPFIQIDMRDIDKKFDYPEQLPILAIKNTVLFPGIVIPITVNRDKSIKAVGAKKTIKVVGDVVDTSKFRRSKQMKGQQKREKSIEDITQTLVDRTGQEVSIPEGLSVKEFSDKVGVPLARVIQELMKNGMLVTLNSQIDFDTCFLIGEAL